VDLMIGHSIVTSWLVDAFELPSWIRSVKGTLHTCSVRNKFMSAFFYTSLKKHRMIHQDCTYVMSNPCQHLVHIDINNLSLLILFVLLFQ